MTRFTRPRAAWSSDRLTAQWPANSVQPLFSHTRRGGTWPAVQPCPASPRIAPLIKHLAASALAGVVIALLALPPPAQARRGDYGWPLAPPHPVLRPFTAPATPYGPGHRGVDLGGSAGEPVLAAGNGTVLFAGEVGGRPVISVAHDDGLHTTYEPVTPTVHSGDPVKRGEPLGTLQPGHEGCPIPACLHWGVRRGQEYLNPLRLLFPGRVRLLPLPPATTALETGLADNNAPRRARDQPWSRKVRDVERRAEQASDVVRPVRRVGGEPSG